jgi:S-methylmethionine-dependent homocysteine/selenocysteine methylase
MKLREALQKYSTILETGPLGTRLYYDYQYTQGPHMAVIDERGRPLLEQIYRADIDVAQAYALPMIVNAATFRASANHLRAHGMDSLEQMHQINKACIALVKEISDNYSKLTAPLIVGAPLGSMVDAYQVETSLTTEQVKAYHLQQMAMFKELGVDFVNALTLSTLTEAQGIAEAASALHLDYTIGFMLNESGTLLDGTPLEEAIASIDNQQLSSLQPLGYLITCTHATVIAQLSIDQPLVPQRLIGVQANGSHLAYAKLAKLDSAHADSPETFAADMAMLKQHLGLKIIAGCCGTSTEHLRALAKACKHTANHSP